MTRAPGPGYARPVDVPPVADPAPGPAGAARIRRLAGDDRVWLGAALAISLLIGWGGEGASTLGWLNPVMLAAVLALRVSDARRGMRRWPMPRWAAVTAFLVTGWAAGMAYELTLSAEGEGFGGMHPETGPSFVIAQGYYVPAVAATWWMVRRYGLDVPRAFAFAGAMAWYEALTVGAASLISPAFVLAPALAAYYVSTYALFGMAGLLVVDHRGIGRVPPRHIRTGRLLLAGVVTGSACWALFLGWAHLSAAVFGFDLP